MMKKKNAYIHWVIISSQFLSIIGSAESPQQGTHAPKREGPRDALYRQELYTKPAVLKPEVSIQEDEVLRNTAARIVTDAEKDPKELVQLLYLAGIVHGKGIEEANRILDYARHHCLERAHPKNMDCEHVDPYSAAIEIGEIASERAYSDGSGKAPGIKGFVDLVSEIPYVGGAGKTIFDTVSGNGVHDADYRRLQQSISPSGPSPKIFDELNWTHLLENDIYQLLRDARRSDSIRAYVEALSRKRGGKGLFDIDPHDPGPGFQPLARREIDAGHTRQYEEWRGKMMSVSSSAWKYAKRDTIKNLTPADVMSLYETAAEFGLRSPATDRFSRYSRYSLLAGPGNSGPSSKSSNLAVNTNIDKAKGEQDVAMLMNLQHTFKLIESVSPNRDVKAAAMMSGAATSILLAMANNATGFGLALNILGNISSLMQNLNTLFGNQPSMQEVLLKKLNQLEAKIDELIADTKNGLNVIIKDGISFRQLVKQEFDDLKRLGYQHRNESLDAKFQSDMNFVRMLANLSANDWNRRKEARDLQNRESINLVKKAETSFVATSTGPLTEKPEFTNLKDAIDKIETSALKFASDGVSIGHGLSGKQKEQIASGQITSEEILGDTVAIDGPDAHLSLLDENLRSKFNIDIRPLAPSYVLQNPDYENLGLTLDGKHLATPLSLKVFVEEMKRLHSLNNPRSELDDGLNKFRADLQCAIDPQLRKIRAWLDIATNTRQALIDIVPEDRFHGLHLDSIKFLFLEYDAEISRGASEVANAMESKLLDANMPLKGYQFGVPASLQKLATDENSAFYFGDAKPNIYACADSNKSAMPPIPLEGHGLEFAKTWIPNEYKVAKHLLGGTFKFCYDDVGPENQKSNYFEHGPDSPGSKSVVHEVSGNLGFTIKIKYSPQDGPDYDVNAIRVTDRGINQQFWKQEYFPVWRDFHPKTAVNSAENARLTINESDPTLKKIGDFGKAQQTSQGDFLGYFPSYGFRDGSNWDKRYELIKERTKNGGEVYAGTISTPYEKQNGPISARAISENNKEAMELLDKNKVRVSIAFMRHNAKLAADAIKDLKQGADKKVGMLADKLKSLDGARARVLATLSLSLGDNFDKDPTLTELQKLLPTSSDLLEQVHLGSPLSNPERARDLVIGLQLRTRNLYRHLKDIKDFKREHKDLDRLIEKLADSFWYHARKRPACSKSQLPDAFNHLSEEQLQNFLKGQSAYAFELTPPRDSAKLSSSSLDFVTKIAKKLTLAEANLLDQRMEKWKKDSPTLSVPTYELPAFASAHAKDPIWVAGSASSAVEALVRSEKGPKTDINSALQHLGNFHEELPSANEIYLWYKTIRNLERNPGFTTEKIAAQLNDFSGKSKDRIDKYNAILAELSADRAIREKLNQTVLSDISRWKMSDFDHDNFRLISERLRDVREVGSEQAIAVAQNLEDVGKDIKGYFEARLKMLEELQKRIQTEPDVSRVSIAVKALERPKLFRQTVKTFKDDQLTVKNREIAFGNRDDATLALRLVADLAERQVQISRSIKVKEDDERRRRRNRSNVSPGANGH